MMVKRPKVSEKRGRRSLGKGYSPGELKKAGLSMSEAVKLHVAVDPRRKTAHEENVEALQTFLQERKAVAKTKKRKRKPKSLGRANDD
ncbi:MAG: ribosomal protein L13e [Candidatus Bathyarchaeia archaeon]